eukprot:5671069-Prymnesium_polylepis.1
MVSVETQPIVLPSSSLRSWPTRVAGLNTNATVGAQSDFQKRIGTALRFVTSEAMSGGCERPITSVKGSMLSGFIFGVRGA